MGNPQRGELTVDLGGTPVPLRLDFSALAAIEDILQQGLFTLAQKFASAEATVRDMAVLLQQAWKTASGMERSLEEVGKAIVHDGLSFHLETCLTLLSRVFDGQALPVKKPQAAGEKALTGHPLPLSPPV